MYILSIISAVFLPLSFLTGLLGINIGGIPGAQNDNAFYIFTTILILIVTAQFMIFKKKKMDLMKFLKGISFMIFYINIHLREWNFNVIFL